MKHADPCRRSWFAAVAATALLCVADAGAQPRAYCPAGAQTQWSGGVLRCQKPLVVASAAMQPCERYPRDAVGGILVDGLTGELVVVAGARDHCNYWYHAGNKKYVLVERYPACPAGYTAAQDAGPNGRDLCVKTALGWVQPVAVPH